MTAASKQALVGVIWAALVAAALVPMYRGMRMIRRVEAVRAEFSPYPIDIKLQELVTSRPTTRSVSIPDAHMLAAALQWQADHQRRLNEALAQRPIGMGLVLLSIVLIGAWTAIAVMVGRIMRMQPPADATDQRTDDPTTDN